MQNADRMVDRATERLSILFDTECNEEARKPLQNLDYTCIDRLSGLLCQIAVKDEHILATELGKHDLQRLSAQAVLLGLCALINHC